MTAGPLGWIGGTLRRLTAAAAFGGILIGLLLYVVTAEQIKEGLARSLVDNQLCSGTRQLRDVVLAHVSQTSDKQLPPPLDPGAVDVQLPPGAHWSVNLGTLSTADDIALQGRRGGRYFETERKHAAGFSDGSIAIEQRGEIVSCNEYHRLDEPRFVKYGVAVYSFSWWTKEYQHAQERYRELTGLAVDRVFIVLVLFSIIAGLVMMIANEIFIGPLLRNLQSEMRAIKEGRQPRIEGTYPAEIEAVKDMLNRLVDVLETSRDETTRVAGKMAHDLNNKLQVIIGATSALQSESAPVKRAVQRAFDVLERYRVILGSVANRTPFPRSINLVEFVTDLVLAQKFNLYNSKVVYRVNGEAPSFDKPAVDIVVLFRQADLDIIVTNLLTNATKYGGGEVDVDIRWDDSDFYLTVSDNGPGIPADKKAMIFEEGYRLEVDVERPGSGFGLPIVRWMVDQCEGEIKVETSPSGGAAFALRFPISRPATTA